MKVSFITSSIVANSTDGFPGFSALSAPTQPIINPIQQAQIAEAFGLWNDVVSMGAVIAPDDPALAVSYAANTHKGRIDASVPAPWIRVALSEHVNPGAMYSMSAVGNIGELYLDPSMLDPSGGFTQGTAAFQSLLNAAGFSLFWAQGISSALSPISFGLSVFQSPNTLPSPFLDAYIATPTIADIDGAGALLGFSSTTRTGDDTYGFNAAFSGDRRAAFDFSVNKNGFVTIYDNGGTDTIDMRDPNPTGVVSSSQPGVDVPNDVEINLTPGWISYKTHADTGIVTPFAQIYAGKGAATWIENAHGGFGNDTLTGNIKDNVLKGDVGRDILEGGLGNDTLDGGAGGLTEFDRALFHGPRSAYSYASTGLEAHVVGPDGNDSIAGIEQLLFGSDSGGEAPFLSGFSEALLVAYGTGNNDTLSGTTSDDLIFGFTGNDSLSGNAGNDVIVGAEGADTLEGGAGADSISGGDSYTTLFPPAGSPPGLAAQIVMDHDVASYSGSVVGVTVDLSRATAQVSAGDASGDVLSGIEDIVGSAFGDLLTGDAGDNVLTGGAGNDTLNGGAGSDILDGGLGMDTVRYAFSGAGLAYYGAGSEYALSSSLTSAFVSSLRAPTDPLNTGIDRITGVETLQFGTKAANVFLGNATSETMVGTTGDDLFWGFAGNDTYVANSAGDLVMEAAGGGIDTTLSSVGWTLDANVENLLLTGATAIIGAGNELANSIIGNSANNLLSGDIGTDTLNGGAGNDTLDGGAGNDILDGGLGIDAVRYAFSGTGLAYEGAGSEYLLSSTLNSALVTSLRAASDPLNTGTDTISGVETLQFGTKTANVFMGSAASESMVGTKGDDLFWGFAGNDTYVANSNGDLVMEAAGGGIDTTLSSISWILDANVENLALTGTAAISGFGNELANSITGNAANNLLAGDIGADTLNGGAGNDTLEGGAGRDLLTGGTGGDTMRFSSATDTPVVNLAGATASTITIAVNTSLDRITDFEDGIDKIDLSGIDANASVAGDQPFAFLGTAAFTSTNAAGGLHYFYSAANNVTVIEASTNSTLASEVQIVLAGQHNLTSSSFVL